MIATTHDDEGRSILVLGFDAENMRRLANDEPIFHDLRELGVPGLENWVLVVLGHEDMVRFIAEFGPNGGTR